MLRVRSSLPPDVEVLVREIIGCAIEVHRQLGPGFLESIYVKALSLELQGRGLAFEREKPIAVRYRTWEIPGQRIDLLVGGAVIVEVKAVQQLDRIHEARSLSYLKTTGLRVGLLVNFNCLTLTAGLRRLVL